MEVYSVFTVGYEQTTGPGQLNLGHTLPPGFSFQGYKHKSWLLLPWILFSPSTLLVGLSLLSTAPTCHTELV